MLGCNRVVGPLQQGTVNLKIDLVVATSPLVDEALLEFFF